MRDRDITRAGARHPRVWIAALACVGVWGAGHAAAWAQDDGPLPPEAKTTTAQLELNHKAVEAVEAKQYEEAIKLFEAALQLGEMNVTYLNLGRTLARVGRCADAARAYDKVMSAPRVPDPPRDVIAQVLRNYRDALKTECPGTLKLTCASPDIQITIDDQPPVACAEGTLTAAAGKHRLQASNGVAREEHYIQLEGNDTVEVTIQLSAPPPPKSDAKLATWGWIVGGVGAATLLTATIVDVAVIGPNIKTLRGDPAPPESASEFDKLKEDTQSAQSLNKGLLIGGGLLLTTGAVLVILDMTSEPSAAPGATLTPWVTPDGTGAAWGTTW